MEICGTGEAAELAMALLAGLVSISSGMAAASLEWRAGLAGMAGLLGRNDGLARRQLRVCWAGLLQMGA